MEVLELMEKYYKTYWLIITDNGHFLQEKGNIHIQIHTDEETLINFNGLRMYFTKELALRVFEEAKEGKMFFDLRGHEPK